jgi:hypothetical protein
MNQQQEQQTMIRHLQMVDGFKSAYILALNEFKQAHGLTSNTTADLKNEIISIYAKEYVANLSPLAQSEYANEATIKKDIDAKIFQTIQKKSIWNEFIALEKFVNKQFNDLSKYLTLSVKGISAHSTTIRFIGIPHNEETLNIFDLDAAIKVNVTDVKLTKTANKYFEIVKLLRRLEDTKDMDLVNDIAQLEKIAYSPNTQDLAILKHVLNKSFKPSQGKRYK